MVLRSTTFAALVASLACAIAAPSVTRAECKLRKFAELPVTMVDAQPTVQVKINGAPVRLLADSGAFFSFLPRATASELGLKTYAAPFGMHVIGVNGEAEVDLTKVKSFGFAGAEVPNVEFLVGGSTAGRAQGIMGQNVLHLGDVEYDFAHGVINLVKPSGCGDAGLAYWTGGKPSPYVAIRSTEIPKTQAVGEVSVNGVRLRATFDTGATTSVMTLAAARRAGIDMKAPEVKTAGLSGGAGRRLMRNWIVPVSAFKIGDEEVKNTHMRVGDLELSDSDMLLGADFFLSHHVLVSNSQSRVYFTYNGGPVFDLTTRSAEPPPEPTALASAVAAAQKDGASPPAAPAAGEPADAEGFARRGAASMARRDYTAALADLSRAVELDPKNAGYLERRAELRLATRQLFLAMSDLDAALKLDPGNGEAHLLRATLRASGRDLAGERDDLAAADHALPKTSDLRLQLAQRYAGLGDFAVALPHYDAWIAAHSDDDKLGVAQGGRCWARDMLNTDIDKALADCNAAVRASRTAGPLIDRGVAHLRKGELDRAITDLDAALALQPKAPWALYARGVARTKKGQAAEGQADIAAATAVNARIPDLAKKVGLTP